MKKHFLIRRETKTKLSNFDLCFISFRGIKLPIQPKMVDLWDLNQRPSSPLSVGDSTKEAKPTKGRTSLNSKLGSLILLNN